MISIVIPTIDGREDHLERCLTAYEQNTTSKHEIIVVENRSSVGKGWDDGIGKARGDFIHLSADDLECRKDWDVSAMVACMIDKMPHPRCYTVNGTLDDRYGGAADMTNVDMTTIPFMTVQMWDKIKNSMRSEEIFFDLHYYSDDWISWLAQKNDIGIVSRHGYDFTHHYAQVGRGAGMPESERFAIDGGKFENLKNEYVAGNL